MPTFVYFLISFCTNILSWRRVYSSYSSDCLPGREPCSRTWCRFKCLRIQEAYRFSAKSQNTTVSSESTSTTQTSGWISLMHRVQKRNIASPRSSPSSLESVRNRVPNQMEMATWHQLVAWRSDRLPHRREEASRHLMLQKVLLTSLRASKLQLKLDARHPALVRLSTSLIVRSTKQISSYLTSRIDNRTGSIKDYWVPLE